eukprot:scaffold115645_cov63-Phaeocystis_antarctica.AAC.4
MGGRRVGLRAANDREGRLILQTPPSLIHATDDAIWGPTGRDFSLPRTCLYTSCVLRRIER